MDRQVEHHLSRLETADTPYIREKIHQEHDNVIQRKIMRDREHERRKGLRRERELELQRITQAKLERLENMDLELMNEEVRDTRKQCRTPAARKKNVPHTSTKTQCHSPPTVATATTRRPTAQGACKEGRGPGPQAPGIARRA